MSHDRSRRARVLWVVAAFLFVAALTAASYLARAGAPFGDNWPANYNLTSSDNGILFQFAHDLFSGFTLDWSFSPQVYVFPEIPLSLIAYLLSGATLTWYFVWVAVINVLLMFAALWWLAHLLFGGSREESLLRAFIATLPLIALPLLAQQSMYLFHLAPTYYYGMYLFGFLLPAALLAPQRWARILVLAGWTLTGAADPLLFAMTLPGALLALFVLFLKRGRRGAFPRLLLALGTATALGLALRFLVFSAIAGTNPTNYISASRAAGRVRGIYSTFRTGFTEGVDPWLLVLTCSALLACGLALVFVLRRYLGAGDTVSRDDRVVLAQVYLTSLPFLGALAMYLILAVHIYYLWFGVVGSIVIAALLLPRPRALRLTAGIGAGVVAVCAAIGLLSGSFTEPRYFGYQSDLARCLDRLVPGEVGYSTFSDGRSNGLVTTSGVHLVAVNPDLSPNFWLTNRAYSKELVGTFILVNPDTAEPPLEPAVIIERWGEPDAVASCGTAEIWSYDSVAAQERLSEWFARYQGLR